MQREICAWSARSGLHPGAAEHPGLFKYHGLPIRLFRTRQPDTARHVDYQPGSEIGYGSSGTQVNHASRNHVLGFAPECPVVAVSRVVFDNFCVKHYYYFLPKHYFPLNETRELIFFMHICQRPLDSR